MIVDFSPLVQAAIGAAGVVITACAPVLAVYLAKKLRLDGNAAAVSAIESAVNTGAGIAYSALAADGSKPASVEIKSAALATGVNHVLAAVPAAVARMKPSEDTIASMVAGRLGHMLAVDPTVPAGSSATLPPPSTTVTQTVVGGEAPVAVRAMRVEGMNS